MTERKRGHRGEGSVTQIADGRWQIRLPLPVLNGRRRRKIVYMDDCKNGETKARELLLKMRADAESPEPSKFTLERYLNWWIETVDKDSVRPNTYASYKYVVERYITPAVGGIRIGRLTGVEVQTFLKDMLRGTGHYKNDPKSPRLVQMTRAVLRKACEYGTNPSVAILRHNPVEGIQGPRVKKHAAVIWTGPEVKHFLNHCQKNRKRELRWHAFFETLVGTGARLGEVLGLQWADIDEAANTIRIARTLIEIKCKVEGLHDPKTSAGNRLVEVPRRTIEALLAHKLRETTRLRKKGLELPAQIFVDWDGQFILQGTVRRAFHKLALKAGLPRIRVHDLRHTSATLLIEAGANIGAVSKRLGHSNVGVTQGIYVHVTEKMAQETASVMTDILGKRQNAT